MQSKNGIFLARPFAAALALAVLVAVCAIAARADGPATVDPPHTSTFFSAKHLILSTVQGFIPVKEAKLNLGAGGIPVSAEAVMDLTKLDSHNDRRDNDLRSERFLDVAKYPEMTFKSTKILPGTGGSFVMDGNLTIRGVTRPVVLNGRFEGTVKDNQGRTHYGYAATTNIDRTQWGVGANVPSAIVGTEITITIELEAIQ